MTTPPTTPRASTRPLTLAGILFIVAGVAILIPLAYGQIPGRNHHGSVAITLSITGILISAGAFVAAYISLYVARPRGGAHWLFLLAALGYLIDLGRFGIPAGGFFGEVIAAVGTVGAGIYIVVRRTFTLIPSLIFLVTVVFALAPFALLDGPSSTGLTYVLEYVGFALYIVCGVAMILGVRARTRSTATV